MYFVCVHLHAHSFTQQLFSLLTNRFHVAPKKPFIVHLTILMICFSCACSTCPDNSGEFFVEFNFQFVFASYTIIFTTTTVLGKYNVLL